MSEAALLTDFDETSRVLKVSGEVDEEAVTPLRLAIEQHSRGYLDPLTVDLTDVTYLPSVAVGVLVRAGKEFAVAGAAFELAAESGSLPQRVLSVSALPHRSY